MAVGDPINCPFCNIGFIARSNNQKYCSSGCNYKHHRQSGDLYPSEAKKACKQAMRAMQLKCCNYCGSEFIGRIRSKHCTDECAAASLAERNKARQARPDVRERSRQFSRQRYRDNPKARERAKARQDTDEYRTTVARRKRERYARGLSAVERANKQIYDRQYLGNAVCWISDHKKKLIDQRTLWAINARQAWRYWVKVMAPCWWLDGYYSTMPWLDHRLTDAEQYRLKYRFNPEFQISERIRRQTNKKRKRDGAGELIRGAIRRGAESRTVERRLGYSIAELKIHLERQFIKGMTWDAFMTGRIHIDHIIPQVKFDLTVDGEWQACWALTNLQPLWAGDNLSKGGTVERLL